MASIVKRAKAWKGTLVPGKHYALDEALSMVMMIPLAAWMGRAEGGLLWRSVGALTAVSLAGATFLTQSRGGLIALAVVGFAALLRARRKPAARCALLAAFGALLTYLVRR